MQKCLDRLTKDLRKLGVRVFFDVDNLQGNLRDSMRRNITQSNCFIVVCTPRWKQRIEAGLTPYLRDCIQHNRAKEVEDGLNSLATNQPVQKFNPTNNASFEFAHIWTQVKRHPTSNNLILLQFSGTFDEAVITEMQGYMVNDVTKHHR